MAKRNGIHAKTKFSTTIYLYTFTNMKLNCFGNFY